MITCIFNSFHPAYTVILNCLYTNFKVDVFLLQSSFFHLQSYQKIKGCNPQLIEEHSLGNMMYSQVAKGHYIGITDKEELVFPVDQMFKVFLRMAEKSECYFETSLFKKKGTCTNEFITDIIIDIVRQFQPTIAYSLGNTTTYITKGSNPHSGHIPIVSIANVVPQVQSSSSIKVIPLTNWCNPIQYIAQLNKFKPRKTNIEFTIQQPDYALVVNSTNIDTNPMKTLYYMMEPNGEQLFADYLGKFKKQDGGMNLALYGSHKDHLQLQEYWISKSVYDLQHAKIQKDASLDNVLSVCVSDRYVDPGHKYRIDLLHECERLEKEGILGFKLNIYGTCKSLGFRNYKGELPEKDKSNGLLKYKYHFNAENHSIHNYITEKFNDALMSECYLFYYGAPNASTYFDGCFTALTGNIQEDIKTIRKEIQAQRFEKMCTKIKEVKQNAILEQNIFCRVESTIILSTKTICLRITDGMIPEQINILGYQSKGWSMLAHSTIMTSSSLEYLKQVFQLGKQHNMNMVCMWKDDDELYQRLVFKYSRSLSLEGKTPGIILAYPRKDGVSLFRQPFFIRAEIIGTILDRIEKSSGITEEECLRDILIF